MPASRRLTPDFSSQSRFQVKEMFTLGERIISGSKGLVDAVHAAINMRPQDMLAYHRPAAPILDCAGRFGRSINSGGFYLQPNYENYVWEEECQCNCAGAGTCTYTPPQGDNDAINAGKCVGFVPKQCANAHHMQGYIWKMDQPMHFALGVETNFTFGLLLPVELCSQYPRPTARRTMLETRVPA